MSELTTVKIEDLKPNPYNPRKTFDDDELQELSKSIHELGLLQPPVVYPENGSFVVVCGDRRRKACELAGLKKIPCRVIDPPRDQAHAVQIALVENLQRAELSTVEEASAICELIEAGTKRTAISKAIGKSVVYVGTRYAVARHPEVLEAYVNSGEKDIKTWALVGGVENEEVRKRIIETLSDAWSYDNYRGGIEAVKRFEKHAVADDIDDLRISAFCTEYENSRVNIKACCSGYGDEHCECKHYMEFSYYVRIWLALGDEYRNDAICLGSDRECLKYKRNQEAKILKKLDKIDTDRFLASYTEYADGNWFEVTMIKMCEKDCTTCKDFFQIPQAFLYGRTEHKLRHPGTYCTAKDSSCFNEKREAFKMIQARGSSGDDSEKSSSLTPKMAREMTDEELRDHAVKVEVEAMMDNLDFSTAAEELMNRGFYAIPNLSFEWVKFEAPVECNAECVCHKDHEHEFEYGYECFENCPHLNKKKEIQSEKEATPCEDENSGA